MSQENKHIIHKLTFDVVTNSKTIGYEYKDKANDKIQNVLLPLLEKRLNKEFTTIKDEFVTIDTLNMDISLHKNALWGENIPDSIMENIKVLRNDGMDSNRNKLIIQDKETKLKDAFIHYMMHGNIPWNMQSDYFESFWEEVSHHSLNSLKAHLLNPSVVERIVARFSKENIFKFLKEQNVLTVKIQLALSKIWDLEILKNNPKFKVAILLFVFANKSKSNQTDLVSLLFEIIFYDIKDNGLNTANQIFLEETLSIFEVTKKNLETLLFNPKNFRNKTIILLCLKRIKSYTHWVDTMTKKYLEESIPKETSKTTILEDLRILQQLDFVHTIKKENIEQTIPKLLTITKNIDNSTQEGLPQKVESTEKSESVLNGLQGSSKIDDIKKPEAPIEKKIKTNSAKQNTLKETSNSEKESNNKKLNREPIPSSTHKINTIEDRQNLSLDWYKMENQEKESKGLYIPEITSSNYESFYNYLKELEDNSIQTLEVGKKNNFYMVSHAGLVILNPYLSPFFKNCGLVDNKGQLKDPELAVCLLNYLATGKEDFREEHMLFEKFLCNFPIESALHPKKISNELKIKCNELLENILQNWDVLKSSSIELLRFEFIQRPGKLELDKEFPIVRLERKTQDILVDRIPWNISINKLPWKKKMFHTIW